MATSFFGGAFFGGEFFSAPTTDTTIRGTSGYHGYDELARRHREREREELTEAQTVIEAVADRQATDSRLDDEQRQQELAGELRLKGIEMRSAHLEALNARREQIIRDELQRIFQERKDAEDIAVLLFLAGSA